MIVVPPTHNHPATFSKELFDVLVQELRDTHRVIDPFSGTGLIHELCEAADVPVSTGVELEPEWANDDIYIGPYRTQIVGDCREMIRQLGYFDCVCTSPSYGNRMADHHDAKDGSKRNTYKHRLGRDLSDGNSGAMQWGEEYREFHRYVWEQCVDSLIHGGKFILNIKDHIRKHEIVHVSDWHMSVLVDELGLIEEGHAKIPCRGNRQGQNGKARVEFESVFTLRKASL